MTAPRAHAGGSAAASSVQEDVFWMAVCAVLATMCIRINAVGLVAFIVASLVLATFGCGCNSACCSSPRTDVGGAPPSLPPLVISALKAAVTQPRVAGTATDGVEHATHRLDPPNQPSVATVPEVHLYSSATNVSSTSGRPTTTTPLPYDISTRMTVREYHPPLGLNRSSSWWTHHRETLFREAAEIRSAASSR